MTRDIQTRPDEMRAELAQGYASPAREKPGPRREGRSHMRVFVYERHGLIQEDILNGIEHYQVAGVSFPPNPKPFELVVMRYRADDAH